MVSAPMRDIRDAFKQLGRADVPPANGTIEPRRAGRPPQVRPVTIVHAVRLLRPAVLPPVAARSHGLSALGSGSKYGCDRRVRHFSCDPSNHGSLTAVFSRNVGPFSAAIAAVSQSRVASDVVSAMDFGNEVLRLLVV